MNKINVYQPWSVPLLHTTLPNTLLKDLIELTDLIGEDSDRVNIGNSLAGELEEENEIDVALLTNIKFKDYILKLTHEYLKIVISNYPTTGDSSDDIPAPLLHLKISLVDINIAHAWFNNQKDNEYNPIHKHNGTLSGVLFLKIPKYLPSRKIKNCDGSITFVGNETYNENGISNSICRISPKVGDIFLFPSNLKHMVYPFRTADGKGIRRSMSFNITTKK